MNRPKNLIEQILKDQPKQPEQASGSAFAPSNIALCKYWGKRDSILNLPVTSSLSISLGKYGTFTKINSEISLKQDIVFLNGSPCSSETPFFKRLVSFLDLFRNPQDIRFKIETETNLPIAAGLASSASGFAACVKALAELYGWNLTPQILSMFARLGSGSACRSLWHGFVEWEKGEDPNGMDSLGKMLDNTWESLRLGLLILDPQQKNQSSREAMKITTSTSEFYKSWPGLVEKHLAQIKRAIQDQDFQTLGETSEANALAMHALMLSAKPPIVFTQSATIEAWHQVWNLRKQGMNIYFTQDAGPNIKLIFLAEDTEAVLNAFSNVIVVEPFFLGNRND